MSDFNATQVEASHVVLKRHPCTVVFRDLFVVFQPSHRDGQGAFEGGLEGSCASAEGAGGLDLLNEGRGLYQENEFSISTSSTKAKLHLDS